MQVPILKVEELSYTYGNGQKALSNINLNIFEGEKIAVLGSNGAGKSTFFLSLNGVLTPDKGKIYYKGFEVTRKNINDLRRNVGIVFQDADNQIIASTVLAEVSFGPMNLKLPKQEVKNRVDKALQYMNISEFRNRVPHYMSGGEKKKVSIADIIAMESEIIVFDEPTASLDPCNVNMLEEVLYKLASDCKTILISTHDVDFAYRWAERIIVFHEGEVLADGIPQYIFNNEKVIEKSNLSYPILLDVCKALFKTNIIPKLNIYPKTIMEFNEMILSLKNKEEKSQIKN